MFYINILAGAKEYFGEEKYIKFNSEFGFLSVSFNEFYYSGLESITIMTKNKKCIYTFDFKAKVVYSKYLAGEYEEKKSIMKDNKSMITRLRNIIENIFILEPITLKDLGNKE